MHSTHWENLTLLQSKKEQKQEFVKKYERTWVWLEYEGKKELVYFLEYDGDFFTFESAEHAIYKIVYDSDAIITASFPEQTLINTPKGFSLFSRIPARQYRKAPCSDNCGFFSPFRSGFSEFSPENLKEAYAPRFTKFEEALQREDVFGRAVSHKFAISLHNKEDDKRILWYKLWPIAEIYNDVITCKAPHLEQEISDFVKRSKLELQIG